MPMPGLSLVGFMAEDDALNYLRTQCIFDDDSDDTLRQHWHNAQQRLGAPISRAGMPRISDIPYQHEPYLDGVPNNPAFATTIGTMTWAFKRVEIAPLLAYQFHIHTEQENTPAAGLHGAPSLAQLLQICLPYGMENIPWQAGPRGTDTVVTAPTLNLMPWRMDAGQLPNQPAGAVGLVFGPTSPLLQVVRFEGRCYLKNGFHRAYQLARAGVTDMPCLLLEATDYAQVGPHNGAVFSRQLLESANPPTCGHFAKNRAYPVTLHKLQRVIRISVNVTAEPLD